jgi:hypothetical protein
MVRQFQEVIEALESDEVVRVVARFVLKIWPHDRLAVTAL